MFDNEQCANYTIYVWLELENDQNWITWPAAYKKEMIEKNIINHRIVFSNYFHLTISPTLEGHDIFYSIRVFFSNDDYTKYKFKTYTKRKTMVVFNSEQPQCNNNTYHIKVWAMPKHWLYLYPTDRPIVHYVCKSKGAGEKRNIYFMNHFQLTIEPKLPEDDEHIYYVEVRCYNNIKMQTFKTITRGSTYVVLHKFSCDAYDIAAQKVPKKWTLQIELFKRAIEETKGALELNVTINNGYTFIFDYDKCLNNWPARSKRITVPTFKNGSTSKQKTDKEKFRTFIELSDDDDENDNESKATKGEKE
uniref:WWE domain-containing protein n=1 Tax=Globodera pallida TaxID=36090 RepID=A0A183CA05_GLOPA